MQHSFYSLLWIDLVLQLEQTPITVFFYPISMETTHVTIIMTCDIVKIHTYMHITMYAILHPNSWQYWYVETMCLGLWGKPWYLLSTLSAITKVKVVHKSYNALHALFPVDHSYCLSICTYAYMFDDFTCSQNYCNLGRFHGNWMEKDNNWRLLNVWKFNPISNAL